MNRPSRPMCAHDSGCGESQRGPLACTLVIPTYGRPKWLVDAVDSALSQRRPFDEVIVVCDGPDPEVTMRLSDRPVRVVSIPKAGVAAARNAGLAAAVTPWVAFLDDDDLLHPDYLHEVAGYLRGHPDAKAINTYFWVFASRSGPGIDVLADDLEQCLTRSADVSPVTDMSYLEIRGDSYRMLLERLCGSMSTAFVAREVLLNAGGFPTGMTCAEDWTMYVHVARDHEWHVVPRRLAFFRDHPWPTPGWVAHATAWTRSAPSTDSGLTLLAPRLEGSLPMPTVKPTVRPFVTRWTLHEWTGLGAGIERCAAWHQPFFRAAPIGSPLSCRVNSGAGRGGCGTWPHAGFIGMPRDRVERCTGAGPVKLQPSSSALPGEC